MRQGRGIWMALAGVAAAGALAGCGEREAEIDTATINNDSPRNPSLSAVPPPEFGPTTLKSGATVLATPTARELQDYLNSDEPAGRVFILPSIRFVRGPVVREDPNGATATIAAMLRAHPNARVRVEVMHANPEQTQVSESSADRARRVADLFVENGVPADRITSAGVNAEVTQAPVVRLVVTAK